MSSPRFASKSELSAHAGKLQKHLASKFDVHLKLTKVQHMLAEMEGYRGFDAFPNEKPSKYKSVSIGLSTSLSRGDFFEVFLGDQYEISGILCVSDVLERYYIDDEFVLDEVIENLATGNLSPKEAFTRARLGHLTMDKLQWIPALAVLEINACRQSETESSYVLNFLIEQVEKINELTGYKQNQGLILAKAIFFSVYQPSQDQLRELIMGTVRDYPVIWSSWVGVNTHSISLPLFPDTDGSVSFSEESLVVGYPYWFRDFMEQAARTIARAYFSKAVQAYFLDNIDAFFFGRTELDSSPVSSDELLAYKTQLEQNDNEVYCFMDRTKFQVPEDWD